MDQALSDRLEAAAFRKLLEHLRNRHDVQNIDLMNMAGFCRNCLSRWYSEAATDNGFTISKDEARTYVYGMSYEEWNQRYRKEATSDQQAQFHEAIKNHQQ